MEECDNLLVDGGGIDVQFSDVSYSVSVWTPGRILGPGIQTVMVINIINHENIFIIVPILIVILKWQ